MSLEPSFVAVEEFDALSIHMSMTMPMAMDVPPHATAVASASDAVQKFPAKLHARKVARELGVKDGLVYLPGLPTPLYEDSDMGPDFRQRRYFYYLGGADFEGCAVTYDVALDHLVLWIPYVDPRQVLWYGTSPGPEQCSETVDVDSVRYVQDLEAFLRLRLGALGHAGGGIVTASPSSSATSLLPPLPPTTLYVLHANQVPKWLQLEVAAGGGPGIPVNTTRLQPAMDHARVVKSGYEIAMIRQANAVSSSAHRAVLQQLKGMANEREIEAVFLDHCLAVHGAKHQAYPVIAGSGPNASVLHYFANDEPLAGRQLVCLDAGAEWACYASDVTRSFPISGQFTPQAAAVYAAVHRMQTEVIERFQPGVPFALLHLHAALVAAEELLRLGILHGATAREILAAGTISAFFPHGLGHHVGLEVHDVLSSDLMSLPPAKGEAGGSRDPANEKAGQDAEDGEDDEDDEVEDDANGQPMVVPRNWRWTRQQRPRRSLHPARRFGTASVSAAAASAALRRGPLGGGKRQLVSPGMYQTLVRNMAAAAPQQTSSASSARSAKHPMGLPKRERRRYLEPGMVVTVEPGIYFCRPYIEAFFLSKESHARFIDQDVLEQYYDVGGVRIEDCLLVTEDGHENLTTAPKGKEALRIINGN